MPDCNLVRYNYRYRSFNHDYLNSQNAGCSEFGEAALAAGVSADQMGQVVGFEQSRF